MIHIFRVLGGRIGFLGSRFRHRLPLYVCFSFWVSSAVLCLRHAVKCQWIFHYVRAEESEREREREREKEREWKQKLSFVCILGGEK